MLMFKKQLPTTDKDQKQIVKKVESSVRAHYFEIFLSRNKMMGVRIFYHLEKKCKREIFPANFFYENFIHVKYSS